MSIKELIKLQNIQNPQRQLRQNLTTNQLEMISVWIHNEKKEVHELESDSKFNVQIEHYYENQDLYPIPNLDLELE